MAGSLFSKKMNKKIALTLTAAVALSATAQADTLIAGWDFSQYFGTGFNSTNGMDFTGAGEAQANYSDFSIDPPVKSANPSNSVYGSIFFDGTNGSSDGNPGTLNGFEIAPATGNLVSANNGPTADGLFYNDLGSYNTLKAFGQEFANNLNLELHSTFDTKSIVFYGNSTNQTTDWLMTFAALTTNGDTAATITWEYSLDGMAYVNAGVTSNITNLDTGYTVDLPSMTDFEEDVYFRGTFNGIDQRLRIDNVSIRGVVVPEPSAVGGLFGLAALLIARRRA